MRASTQTGATTARASTAPSPMLTGVDTLIVLLERQAADLASKSESAPGAVRGVPAPGVLGEQMDDLDLFIRRLKQMRDWLRQDPRLLPVVDDAIGKQVRDLERRQTWQNYRLAFATTVGGALLGWLISLLGTPTTVLHLLGH